MKKKYPIKISVNPGYIPAQSDPSHSKFVFFYEITIENESDEIVQLLHRHWIITDMRSKIEEVSGAGVIGLQPIIRPGKKFFYNSYCHLVTPQGTMEGYYEMQNLEEEKFKVKIPKFVLSAPSVITKEIRDRMH